MKSGVAAVFLTISARSQTLHVVLKHYKLLSDPREMCFEYKVLHHYKNFGRLALGPHPRLGIVGNW